MAIAEEPPTTKSPEPSNVFPLIVFILVAETKVACFAFKAVCVAVDTGLFASDVLSTFDNPTAFLSNV